MHLEPTLAERKLSTHSGSAQVGMIFVWLTVAAGAACHYLVRFTPILRGTILEALLETDDLVVCSSNYNEQQAKSANIFDQTTTFLSKS